MNRFKKNKVQEKKGPAVWEFGQRVDEPLQNRVIGSCEAKNSKIVFRGKGNTVVLEDSIRMESSSLIFNGDNALIYLSSNKRHIYKIRIDMWRETTAYFGHNNYFNGPFTIVISERKNLVVGNDGVFAFGLWLRTADPHLIYDCDTLERINPSKSILIGDHVWLGQNALILKGSAIGSGSILSAAAVLAGKTVPSNSVYAGNPARKVKENIFFSGESVHDYTVEQSEGSMVFSDDRYIYHSSEETINWSQLDEQLSDCSVDKRLDILQNLSKNTDKNRFYL